MYKVTIEEVQPLASDDRYPRTDTIYQQVVKKIDIMEIIHAINKADSLRETMDYSHETNK
jgi:hypothetical protein